MEKMIRHREGTPAPADEAKSAPPDLHLAGMRCAQVRPPTPPEERILRALGYGGGAAGTLSALFLIETIRNPIWAKGLMAGPLFLLGFFASIIGLAFACTTAGPALRSLRRRRVYVFRGPVQGLGRFDANQKKLFANRTYPDEVVVMANRKTVLRSGNRFLPRLEPLREPVLVALDRGPDTRELTEEEKAELRRLIRRYGVPDLSAWVPLFIPPIMWYVITEGMAGQSQTLMICACILLAMFAMVYSRLSGWWSFARQLKGDLRDGVITSGNLWSGIPWLVDGEPAPWRKAQPEVGVNALNLDALKTL